MLNDLFKLAALMMFRTMLKHSHVHKTNATFFRRGTRQLDPRALRPSRYAFLPGYQKLAIKWTVFLTFTAGPIYYWANRSGFYLAVSLIAVVIIVVGVIVGIVQTRSMLHRTRVVIPLYAGLCRVIPELPPNGDKEWLTVPRNFREQDARVRVQLPPDFVANGQQQKEVAALVQRRLTGEWAASWAHSAHPPYVEFRHLELPPAMVNYDMIRADMDKSADANPIVGYMAGMRPYRLQLDSDAPHLALSIGTGGGKSSTLRLLIAQWVRLGTEVDILDPKRVSLNEFRGVPGVTIHRDIAAMSDAIHAFRVEMEERYAKLDFDDSATFPRKLLVIEEQNSFAGMLYQWWEENRTNKDPRKPPAMTDLAFCLFQGRQANMNIVSVLQQANARAMGGSDMRDQYGLKILARFSVSVWRMLVDTYPRPKSSRHPGRAIALLGDEQTTIQTGFITPMEARAYALSRDTAHTLVSVGTGKTAATVTPTHDTAPTIVSDTVASPVCDNAGMTTSRRYTLQEASVDEHAIVKLTYGALRTARSRDPEFPKGEKKGRVATYTAEELKNWERNRPRKGK